MLHLFSALATLSLQANSGILQKPVDQFCRGTNELMKKTVAWTPIGVTLRDYAVVREATNGPAGETALESWKRKALAPPESPGISRPVSMVILASVPTALGWYGWYKFSVEEELFQDEIATTGHATGCGGYGTLLPFVYAFLIGGAGTVAGVPHADAIIVSFAFSHRASCHLSHHPKSACFLDGANRWIPASLGAGARSALDPGRAGEPVQEGERALRRFRR